MIFKYKVFFSFKVEVNYLFVRYILESFFILYGFLKIKLNIYRNNMRFGWYCLYVFIGYSRGIGNCLYLF